MKKTAKVFTIITCILSGVFWLMGILTFLFNVMGLWVPWLFAGFGFFFLIPHVINPQILAIVFSFIAKNKKMIIMNFIFSGVSSAMILFTLLVSITWLW